MFDFETSVSGIEFKVRQLADEVVRLRTLVSAKEDELCELKKALTDKADIVFLSIISSRKWSSYTNGGTFL